jgi:hypothetical protein
MTREIQVRWFWMQTNRLKWACQQKGDGHEEESLYKSLLHKASDYFHGHAGHDLTEPNEIMAAGGEKRETE